MTVISSFGRKLGPEFGVGQQTFVSPSLSNATGLDDGGYAVVDNLGGLVRLNVYGSVFDTTTDFNAQFGVDVVGEPVVTKLADGNVALAWKEGPGGANGVVATIINPETGQAILPPKEVLTGASSADPEIFALRDGGFAITFKDGNSIGLFQVSNAGQTSLLSLSVFPGLDPSVVQLEGGRVAVAHTLATGDVVVKLFEQDGTPVEGIFQIPVGAGGANSPQVAALKNGGFAVVYDDDDIAGTPGWMVKSFDKDGVEQDNGGRIRFDTSDDNLARQEQDPDIAVLDNGFIVVAYTSETAADNHDIRYRVFDPDGIPVKIGNDFDIPLDVSGGDQTQPSVAALKGGSFVITWTDSDGNRISSAAIELSQTLEGDGAPDPIFGSAIRDVIFAGDGADTIGGLEGRDNVSGEGGDDQIVVFEGHVEDGEVYNGGEGLDELVIAGEFGSEFDFRDCTVTGFERLSFNNLNGGGANIRFNADQFEQFGLVAFDFPAAPRVIFLNMKDETVLDLSAVPLQNAPEPGTEKAFFGFGVVGDRDAETVVASRFVDDIDVGGGDDTVSVNLGVQLDGNISASDAFRGGEGFDLLSVTGPEGSVIDFRKATVEGFENLGVSSDGGALLTLRFTAVQFKQFSNVSFDQQQVGARTVDITMGDETLLNLSKFQSGISAPGDGFRVRGDESEEIILASGLIDNIDAGDGADTVQIGDNAANESDAFRGGDGVDNLSLSLRGGTTADLRGSTVEGFEQLSFEASAGGATAFFTAEQFKQFESVGFAPPKKGEIVVSIDMRKADALDLSGVQITSDPNPGSRFEVTGDQSGERVVASVLADEIDLGAGRDTVRLAEGSLQTGDTFNGGASAGDLLQIVGSGETVFDFRSSEVEGFERLFIESAARGGATARFTADQFSEFDDVSWTPQANSPRVVEITMGDRTSISLADVQVDRPRVDGDGFRVLGDADAEKITGSAISDTLAGGPGDDTLVGGAGEDLLVGGKGDDRLFGGADADIFQFAKKQVGTDVIADFGRGDRFDLLGGSFLSLDVSRGDTTLTYRGGEIVVRDVTGLKLDEWNDLVV